jgi:preprotein translocase subunit SecF
VADSYKKDFFNIVDVAEHTEIRAVLYNDSDAKEELVSIKEELYSLSNKIFVLEGSDNRAENYDTIQSLKKDVLISYAHISSEQNDLLRSLLSKHVLDSSISRKERTASLSSDFIDKAVMVVIYSVILTSIVIFLIFRTVVPSIAVLAGVAADVIFALGAMALFDIPLTLASFAALLMLIGFSLDTDILLTIRLVKRKDGTPAERAFESMKTGMTMSLSTMVAFLALFIIAMVTKINIYYEISAVAIAGLIGDLVATWFFNAVIVLYHVEDLLKKGISLNTRPILSYIFKN